MIDTKPQMEKALELACNSIMRLQRKHFPYPGVIYTDTIKVEGLRLKRRYLRLARRGNEKEKV